MSITTTITITVLATRTTTIAITLITISAITAYGDRQAFSTHRNQHTAACPMY